MSDQTTLLRKLPSSDSGETRTDVELARIEDAPSIEELTAEQQARIDGVASESELVATEVVSSEERRPVHRVYRRLSMEHWSSIL